MNLRSSASRSRSRHQIRSVDKWADPILELFDTAAESLDRHNSLKTDHASTVRNLRIAFERMVDDVILEIQNQD